MKEDWIPLLSPCAFELFTAEAFKVYVRGLNTPRRVKRTAAVKKTPPPFAWRVNAKGTLVITIRRKPKWLTRAEVDGIAAAAKIDSRLVWLKVMAKKSAILIMDTEESASRIAKALDANV